MYQSRRLWTMVSCAPAHPDAHPLGVPPALREPGGLLMHIEERIAGIDFGADDPLLLWCPLGRDPRGPAAQTAEERGRRLIGFSIQGNPLLHSACDASESLVHQGRQVWWYLGDPATASDLDEVRHIVLHAWEAGVSGIVCDHSTHDVMGEQLTAASRACGSLGVRVAYEGPAAPYRQGTSREVFMFAREDRAKWGAATRWEPEHDRVDETVEDHAQPMPRGPRVIALAECQTLGYARGWLARADEVELCLGAAARRRWTREQLLGGGTP